MSGPEDLTRTDIDAIIASDDWKTRAALRAATRRSLYTFTKLLVCYNEPKNTMTPEVFKERQDWIQWVVCEHKRGLLEDPRGYIKSTGNTRAVPPWLGVQRPDERYDHPNEIERAETFLLAHPHIKGPDNRIAIAGDTKKAATRFTGSIRRFYLANPLYRWLYLETIWDNPLRTDYGCFNDEEMFIPGRRQLDLVGGFLLAVGTETAIVGGRLDGLIVNDLVGDHNWHSSGEMARLRDWVKTAPGLLSHRDPAHPDAGFVIDEGNRWTLDDVNSMIHSDYPVGAVGRRGVFRCYVHGLGSCGRWGSDDERQGCAPTDESLWKEGPYPDKESLARLEREEGPVIFAAQRLNDPTKSSDLDVSKLRYFTLDIAPVRVNGVLERLWSIIIPTEGSHEEIIPLGTLDPHVLSLDPASSQEKTAARTCISWFAKDRATGRRFNIDIRADRYGPDESVWQFIELYEDMVSKIHGKSIKPVIEKVAAQTYMASAIRLAAVVTRDGTPRHPKLRIPEIEMLPPAQGFAKIDRGKRRVGHILGQGLLYVRAGLQLPGYEIRHFPTGTMDWIDSAAQAEENFLRSYGGADSDKVRAGRMHRRAMKVLRADRTGVSI